MADRAAALRFTADLAALRSVEQFARVAMRGLAELVPADLWGFNDLDPSSQQMVALIWPEDGAEPEHFEAVAKAVWEHPVVRQFEQTGNGSPTRLSDLWSAERYHASALYRDAYAGDGRGAPGVVLAV